MSANDLASAATESGSHRNGTHQVPWDRRTGVRIALVLIFSCAFVVTSSLKHRGEDWGGLLLEFGREVGFAGLVALVMIFVIERHTRDRLKDAIEQIHLKQVEEIEGLQQSIARNLLDAVYKLRFPETIVSRIKGMLLDPSVYRSDLRLEMFFRRSESAPALLEVDLDASYTIVHAAGVKPALHDIVMHADDLERPCRSPMVSLDGRALWGAGSKNGSQVVDVDTQHCRFDAGRRAFTLQLEPGERRRVQQRVRLEKPDVGWEVWSNAVISEGLSVVAQHPPDIEVQVFLTELGTVGAETKVARHKGRTEWRFDEPLLPGQAIIAAWGPRGRHHSAYAESLPEKPPTSAA